ncbi:MAG: nuclear transport factor 2 family protein [Actinomycetota bacterium]|nr:nuclear transport factor 2 family protein [Actinomycetota bacterium]
MILWVRALFASLREGALWVLGAAAVVLALTVAARGEDGPLPDLAAVRKPSESALLHRAAPQNTSANSTYLDYPLANENPDAVLSVTQNWNPGGGAGTYNDHPIGVWYDADAERWAIFNQDRSPMPEGAAFNVLVFGDLGEEASIPGPPGTTTTAADQQASVDMDIAESCYVDAVNAEDLNALVGCFSPEGVVVDVSDRIEGQDAIRRWAVNEVMGGTLEVLEAEPRTGGVRLLVHWAPEGSSGWRAYYTFEAKDGRIVAADLQYA